MSRHFAILAAVLLAPPALAQQTKATPAQPKETVVQVHGLCRTSHSMKRLARDLEGVGYSVVNVAYQSRQATIPELAREVVGAALADPRCAAADQVHVVAHSLGAILVRSYLATQRPSNLGRVVMLGPPNHGSELVDRLGDWKIFGLINGPAGQQLGTGATSVPNSLGPAEYELGIIAGDRSINLINSHLIEGPDDGKVSIKSTRLTGMTDHLVVHATHPYLMKNRTARRQILHFLENGTFKRDAQ